GRVIDPMTYVGKAAGAGLSKIGDVTKALKGIGNVEIPKLPENAITLPEGALKLPDGTVHLPEGSVIPDGAVKLPDGNFQLPHDATVLPQGTTKLPTAEGAPAQYLDPHGNILDDKGNVVQHAGDAPKEPGGTDLAPPSGSDVPHTPSPVREPALVGAGAHTAEQAGQHIRLGDSLGNDLGDVGRTGDDAAVHAGGENVPTVHAGGDAPTVHAGGDGLPGGHTGDDLPGGHAGDDLPGGSADHLPGGGAHEHGAGPSASHEPPNGHTGGHTDGPGGTGHHDAGSTGGHDGPADGDHGDTGNAGGSGDGPGGGGEQPFNDPDRFSEGEHVSSPPTGPMTHEQEAGVQAALDRVKMSAQDQQRLLTQLRKGDYGAGVAEHVARGDFEGMPGYRDLLFQTKQKGMLPAVHQAMEYAAELKSRGVEDLAFEYKNPQRGLDLDVLVKSGDEIKYGCQLKDVQHEGGVASAARKIAEKQLVGEIDGPKVALLDVHDTRAALTERTVKDLEYYARRTGATYQLRFRDGSVTIPANGQIYP
ncbi:hypothetical protein ACFYMU_29620, partial [Streptomyces sp. NPDC007264]